MSVLCLAKYVSENIKSYTPCLAPVSLVIHIDRMKCVCVFVRCYKNRILRQIYYIFIILWNCVSVTSVSNRVAQTGEMAIDSDGSVCDDIFFMGQVVP